MRVSVTGINGFVGNALQKNLVHYPDIELVPQLHFKDSLGDIEKLTAKTNPCDVIVHLASKTYVPDSFDKPYFFYKNNVDATLAILELCRQKEIKLIFLSSYVYGQPQYFPINENHPLEDFNPYAHSKILGEQLCSRYAKYFNLKYTILRPFNIYGNHQPEHFLVSKIISMAKKGAIVLEDSRPKRDYLHVDDVAKAILNVISYDVFDDQAYNLCSGYSVAIHDIVQAASSIYPQHTEVVYSNKSRPFEILDVVGDNTKAKTELYWTPQRELIPDILTKEI